MDPLIPVKVVYLGTVLYFSDLHGPPRPAGQTQTTLRAANATKTDKRAAKLLKKSYIQNILIENAFILNVL